MIRTNVWPKFRWGFLGPVTARDVSIAVMGEDRSGRGAVRDRLASSWQTSWPGHQLAGGSLAGNDWAPHWSTRSQATSQSGTSVASGSAAGATRASGESGTGATLVGVTGLPSSALSSRVVEDDGRTVRRPQTQEFT